MRARLLAPVVPLLLLVAGCSASVETGTEQDPELIAQAPPYEVVEEQGTDITVAAEEGVVELSVQAVVAELQEDRTEDGLYTLSVLCAATDEELATAEWALGDEALEESGFQEGEIVTEVDAAATCDDA